MTDYFTPSPLQDLEGVCPGNVMNIFILITSNMYIRGSKPFLYLFPGSIILRMEIIPKIDYCRLSTAWTRRVIIPTANRQLQKQACTHLNHERRKQTPMSYNDVLYMLN